MAIYMKYDNGKIKGDATQGKHKDWIGIRYFNTGVARSIATIVGHAKGRESSEPSFNEITIKKSLDSASLLLFQDACVEKKGKSVVFDFCTTDDEGAPYLTVELTNAVISGFSMDGADGAPDETLTLNFTGINFNEMTGNQKNAANQPIKAGYDTATASTSSSSKGTSTKT